MKDRMSNWSMVCKRFCIFLLFLVFVCSFPCIRATAEYHTGHYTIEFPYPWKLQSYYESEDKTGNLCLICDPIEYINEEDAGIIYIFEKELREKDFTRDTVYDILVSVFSEEEGVTDVKTESIVIDGVDSILLTLYREGDSELGKCTSAFCWTGNYALIVTFFDIFGLGEAADAHFYEHLQSINTTPDQSKDDEERFTYAAHQVFGNSLFSSRAGKYPTVEIKTDCSDWSARKDIYKKTIQFLEKVKGLRDEYGFDFQDIRINAYADVMDVYGNTDFMSILGFNISAEDIDKINYEKIPSENVPKIAFNWFDLKLLP